MSRTQFRFVEITELLKLAAPVALTNLLGYLMQVVDTLMVGKVSTHAIGGVSLGNSVFVMFMVTGLGILTGLDFIISHDFGAGKQRDCNRSLVQAIYLSSLISFPAVLAMFVISYSFESFGIGADVAREAGIYLRYMSLSLWPFLLFNAFRQYLQAMGIAAIVSYLLIAANVLNLLANWILVFGNWGAPRLEIAGSAIATGLSRVFMLVAIGVWIATQDRKRKWGLAQVPLEFSKKLSAKIVKLGLPITGHLLLEMGIFGLATLLIGRLGAIPLAAHQIVLQIAGLTFMASLGISSAGAVNVGQMLGRANPKAAVRIGWLSLILITVLMFGSALVMFLMPGLLISPFTSDGQVIALGKKLLFVAAVFQLVDGVQAVGAGVLRGSGKTRPSMIANLIGHWFIGLPIGYVLSFVLGWGAQGMWIGLSVGLACVAVGLSYIWKKRADELSAS